MFHNKVLTPRKLVTALCLFGSQILMPAVANESNLLTNPGFEAGSTGWNVWGGSSVSAVSPRTGVNGVMTNGSQGAEQTVTGLKPNTSYILTAWAKGSAGQTVRIGAKSYGAGDNFVNIDSSNYTEGAINFTTGSSNTSAVVYFFQPGGSGEGFGDDFSLVEVVSETPPANGVIENSSFEQGDKYWKVYGGTSISQSSPYSGDNSLYLSSTQGGAEYTLRGLQPNSNYKITAQVRSENGGSISVGVRNHGGNQQYYRSTNYSYKQVTVEFNTGTANTSAIIYVWGGNGTVGYVDDVQVEYISEWDYYLDWSDEFNGEGGFKTENWRNENGFVRNNELQYYKPENAFETGGNLVIQGRRETGVNAKYDPNSSDWRKSREFYNYTSASLNSFSKYDFKYGRVEVRAKVTNDPGTWPAIWTLGKGCEWPSNGEVDIMENYKGGILANFAWGTNTRWTGKWDSSFKPVSEFAENWTDEFHIWTLDWDHDAMSIYVDDVLLNTIDLDVVFNGTSACAGENPFRKSQYLLLNLAIGGTQGGDPSSTAFPNDYLVDYVRVYKKKSEPNYIPAPENVALNKPVTVDSTAGSNAAANAVDGNYVSNSSRWISANTATPHWIEIDLEQEQWINGFGIWTGWNGYNRPAVDFKFQYQLNGEWVDLVSKNNNSLPVYTTSFFPVQAKKVRFYQTRGQDNYLRVFEIEVWGYTPTDTDGDGVFDHDEDLLGLNINNPDTDGDGVNDDVDQENQSIEGMVMINGVKSFVTDRADQYGIAIGKQVAPTLESCLADNSYFVDQLKCGRSGLNTMNANELLTTREKYRLLRTYMRIVFLARRANSRR